MKKIYLDVDEEITSVIDRLKGADEADLALVVPKESGLLQSVVNLKLLKREAEKLNKNISIITSNKVGRTLAENVGLLVEAGKGSAPTEDPVENLNAEEKESVLIEFREEPKEDNQSDDDVIAFKKGKVGDEEEISIKESDFEKASTDETTEEELKKDIGVGKDEKPKGNEEKPNLINQKKKRKLKLNGFVLAIFLTFIGLFIFGYIYMPRATITVKILAEKKEFETDITVDKKEPDSKIERGLLSGDLVELEKDFQKKFKATGKKEIGTKAKGTILVKNTFSTSSQTLVKGTRFDSNGLIFRSLADVEVPGYSDPGGGIVAGQANIQVEADKVGPDYNIGSGSFIIPGFQGTAKFEKIKGTSNSSMAGGESRQATVVTDDDISNAKESYTKEVEEEAKKALREKAKKDYSLPDEAIELKLGDFTSSPQADAEANEFALNVKANLKGLAYKEREMKEGYLQKLKDEAGTSREVVEDGFDKKKLTVSKPDFENGSLSLNIKSDVYFGTAIDKKTLFTEVSGQTEKKSLDYLTKLEGVEDASIDFWPGFLKRIPRLEKHVTIQSEAIQKKSEGVKKDE